MIMSRLSRLQRLERYVIPDKGCPRCRGRLVDRAANESPEARLSEPAAMRSSERSQDFACWSRRYLARYFPLADSCFHRWLVGDLLMWNNLSVLHRRDPFDPKTRRVMHRSQIKGDERVA